MAFRFLRLGEVRHLTGLSRSTIYCLIAKGQFPNQVPLSPGGRSVGWVDSEVADFVARRIAER